MVSHRSVAGRESSRDEVTRLSESGGGQGDFCGEAGRDAKVRFTPRMYLEYYLARHELSLNDLAVAPTVVGTWFPKVTEYLAAESGAVRADRWPYGGGAPGLGLFTARLRGGDVSFTTFAIGAPGTVAVMEELAAAGASRFIGLGMAGSLMEGAPVGSVILPLECIREEGTSYHYLPASVRVGPNHRLHEALSGALTRAGLAHRSGPHWTTDAIYRELVEKIEAYRARGVLGVDMETSAMYAFGEFTGAAVANLLVVSDELWHEWRPAFHSDELREAMRRTGRALLDALEEGVGDV